MIYKVNTLKYMAHTKLVQLLQRTFYQEGSRKEANRMFETKPPDHGPSDSISSRMENPTSLATRIKSDNTLKDVEELTKTAQIDHSLSVHDPGDGDSCVSIKLIKESSEITKEERKQDVQDQSS